MERCIVHIDLDTFFVSVERLYNESLKNKAVIIGGGDRGVVASCSYEARTYGIHSAMPIVTAKRLCPQAIFLKGTSGLYSKHSRIVTDIIREQAPLFQKSSIDEFYLDLSGMDKFIGTYKWATALREKILKETGLPISFGMSVNKLVAKIATGFAKPNGQKKVEQHEIQDFLDPLAVSKIPGIGKKMNQQLHALKIEYIHQLRKADLGFLEKKFGKYGIVLHKKACGIDNTPVISSREAKSISTETTLNTDTLDVEKIHIYLSAMVNKLCFRLRKKEVFTNEVSVKIRYSNFHTTSRQMQINNSADDREILLTVRKLFHELYDNHSKIRLVGVRLGNMNTNGSQLQIFEDHDKRMKLYRCMDDIKTKYGEHKIVNALLVDNRINKRFKP